MNLREYEPIAPLTTFHIGGPARFFIEGHAEKDIEDAIIFARENDLPLLVLGRGSNVLVSDEGVKGIVLKIEMDDIMVTEDGDALLLTAGAGAFWEDVVDKACERGVFGIENLAGIPCSIGGAIVQNIGAYGATLSDVFEYADCIDKETGLHKRVVRDDAEFAYRSSIFKRHKELIITRVALRLKRDAEPNVAYADLIKIKEKGVPLSVPFEIAGAVRAIRSEKFPNTNEAGTAGSFFKNPIIQRELADSLADRFPNMPTFPQENGGVKIPLAWLLDYVLSLKGFSKGNVRLYEKQPLVIVAHKGATAEEIKTFAREIYERVFAATGIKIENEVEMFGEQK